MSGPFKLKYSNSAFPFKGDSKKKQKNTKYKTPEKERQRERQIRRAIRRGDAPPVTKETLQHFFEAVRGSKDILT